MIKRIIARISKGFLITLLAVAMLATVGAVVATTLPPPLALGAIAITGLVVLAMGLSYPKLLKMNGGHDARARPVGGGLFALRYRIGTDTSAAPSSLSPTLANTRTPVIGVYEPLAA